MLRGLRHYPGGVSTWMNIFSVENFSKVIVLSSIEHNELEKMYLLWTYPQIPEILGLEISNFNEGIQARNEQGEVVLKLICWECDFLGYERLTEEVARIQEAQLLMREDYFQRLCNMLKVKPKYLRLIV